MNKSGLGMILRTTSVLILALTVGLTSFDLPVRAGNADRNAFRSAVETMPAYEATKDDRAFLAAIREALTARTEIPAGDPAFAAAFERTSFLKGFHGFAIVLYQPGKKRIVVIRQNRGAVENIRAALNSLITHPRLGEFSVSDPAAQRIQIDFILDNPEPFELEKASESALDDRRFETGVDGLVSSQDGKSMYFLPGDAFVRSIMGMGQLARHLSRSGAYSGKGEIRHGRFRSVSFVSWKDTWLRLYRGYPLVGGFDRAKLDSAARLGVDYLVRHQKEDGRFLYYYDAARDSFRDHEHPDRDPEKDPYYNELRHNGGGLLLLYDYKLRKDERVLAPARKAIEFLIKNTVVYKLPDGREAAHVYYNRKSKLGGAGIGLYFLSEYQELTGDKQYEKWARLLARHLESQVTETGEFLYYSIYLDRPVTPDQNGRLFSFYYPGEALIGMATYYKFIASEEEKPVLKEKMKKAMHFLLEVRPKVHAAQYTSLPSDSWLMMAVNEMWDAPELRDESYRKFAFKDGDRMVSLMYRKEDALYPDYVGAFYYNYGDFPYADGARAEGLMGAYELAVKSGDKKRAAKYLDALRSAAWASLHLVNTPESMYFAANPELAVGGIRFKHTRQWFRVDTIQHVAAFYLKFLPYLNAKPRKR